MEAFEESRFRAQVDKALARVKTILANARSPQYPTDVPHKYDDKYGLAEFLTNTTLAAQLNVLEALGLTTDTLKDLIKWAQKRSVTLRFKSEERCVFDREEKRKEESTTEYVTEVKSSLFGNSKRTEKTITTITEYFWKYDFEWELFAFRGNKPTEEDSRIVLKSRQGQIELKTTEKSTPRPEVHVEPSLDVNITWLLQKIKPETLQLQFAIDRLSKECRTPRRNPDVESALEESADFSDWCENVTNFFEGRHFPVYSGHALDLSSLHADQLFVPIVALFEEGAHELAVAAIESAKDKTAAEEPQGSLALVPNTAANNAVTAILPVGDVNAFLAEQKRSMLEKFGELDRAFPAPSPAKHITTTEANFVVTLKHAGEMCQCFSDGIEFIEEMLRKQLVSAIGREIGPIDFENYMKFHQRKLYRTEFEPRPFSYAIRRPEHYPEGTVSIEAQQDNGTIADPIYSSVRHIPGSKSAPMRFPINAATNIVFGGDRYLHAWMQHEFEGESGSSVSLVARARQFSSFILLVGRIASAEVFEPKAAIIIQNKDELNIPLMLETIPTPKEFRDAIESLSPEQQRFCQAYRAMQLESTLFGVCVIQIKPQLERLLNLPADSLTKEIRLSQDLMELFMKYQVPSDQLSFDISNGRQNTPAAERVAAVKRQVKAMQDMIEEARQMELRAKAQETAYEMLDTVSSYASMEKSVKKRAVHSKDVKKKKMKKESKPMKEMAKMDLSIDFDMPAASAAMEMPSEPTPSTSSNQPADQQAQSNEPKQFDLKAGINSDVQGEDFTKIPAELDAKYEALDEDAALRPTIINPGTTWTRKSFKGLLADASNEILNNTEQSDERNKAYDLLDALSRSGSLPIEAAELHVVIAATHCFDKSLINTVIQDNVNPIEKVERSSLIMATTILGKPALELIKDDQSERVRTYSPMLFGGAAKPAIKEN